MAINWSEFLAVASLHLLAVISPGPDFAVTTRYSMSFGRQVGRWVALGIGCGILIHVTYSVLGVALLIHRHEWLYGVLLWVGAGYFAWLGGQAIQAQPKIGEPPQHTREYHQLKTGQAFRIGFLTNALNVKATLFFMALFTTVIQPTTLTTVKISYGLYMALVTAIWFVLLSTLITWQPFYQRLWHYSHWVDRGMGMLLLVLAVKLVADGVAVIMDMVSAVAVVY